MCWTLPLRMSPCRDFSLLWFCRFSRRFSCDFNKTTLIPQTQKSMIGGGGIVVELCKADDVRQAAASRVPVTSVEQFWCFGSNLSGILEDSFFHVLECIGHGQTKPSLSPHCSKLRASKKFLGRGRHATGDSQVFHQKVTLVINMQAVVRQSRKF